MTDAFGPEVRDVPAERRFVLEQAGTVAELVYRSEPGRLVLVHTEVPDQLGGRGIGGRLVRAAVDRAAADHLTVVPWCPFARRWQSGHPDVAGAIAVNWEPPPTTATPGEADEMKDGSDG